jgi:integrase
LAVRVTAAGVKSYVFEGKLDRITIRMTIGKCFDWTIEDARKEARRLQGLVDRGIDPRDEKKSIREAKQKEKKESETIKKYTLKTLLYTYTGYLDAKGKERTAAGVRSVVKVHLVEADPELSDKPARDVTPHDIAGLIRNITEKGKGRTAGIFRSSLAAAYSCARRAPFDGTLPKSFIDFNIETNPVDPIPTIPVKARNRTLNRTELKSYIESLGDNTVDLALKLALYAGGQRMAQLLRAEVTDWTPETRTLRLMDPKGKRSEPREHLLPLAPVAASIVDELLKRAESAKSNLLFPSNTLKTPLHVSTPGPRVTQIAGTIGEPFDLRDIRRTCETMLAELGISRDIRAQLLSHGISGVQAVHYDRYSYTKEKRAALVKWERYLKQITSGEEEKKVIPIAEAKGGR